MENLMRFRHNAMNVTSVSAFEGIRGGINQNCKDVYFVRFLGVSDTLVSDVSQMDKRMAERMHEGRIIYRRILKLPQGCPPEEIPDYESFYRAWTEQKKDLASAKVLPDYREYAALLGSGLKKILEIYSANKTFSASMEKNFIIKMMYWHDFLLSDAMKRWEPKQSVKLVLSNITKKQEYLFACLLTFLGCDVLLLQSEADISKEEEDLNFSQKVILGDFSKINLPDPQAQPAAARASEPAGRAVSAKKTPPEPVSAARPVSAGKPAAQAQPESVRKPVSIVRPASAAQKSLARQEKSFEQLALLASSVVMIGIHDKKGDMIGTGSGIMIGKDGYILTNSHVASGGCFYSIRIEEEETVYSTDELIKYHSVLDLAVLRIERRLNPLPIYSGSSRLVRGQKVVAIGSPLGLFNSVSDGIISGFRKIDGVDMIQFTAPTSHGSSGGALLNMYGEVIGISTAGFDNAQNINLAVGYESIHPFIKGFT